MLIKATLRCHFTPVRMVIIRYTTNNKCAKDVKKRKYLYITGRTINWCSHCVKQYAAAAAAKSLQSCPTLCDPMDCSLPGSPVPGILQARTLEWAAISFSNAWKWKVKVKMLSRIQLLATTRTAVYQAPLSMGFSRQEYWSRVPSASLWILTNPPLIALSLSWTFLFLS